MRNESAIVSSVLGLLGCAKGVPEAVDAVDAVRGVCDLPALHADHDGQRVKVRGLFAFHAHGVFLMDKKCPHYMLTLKHTDNGPDITLCTPERLVQEFGCPGGNGNGPIVTVSGVLEPSKTPEYGRISADAMTDFENIRTGERFNP